MSKEPKEQRESGAEDEAGDDGKVKGGVFATVDDVARQAAEAEGEFAAEVEKTADKDEEAAENEESAAEFTDRIHQRDCMRNEAESNEVMKQKKGWRGREAARTRSESAT